MHFYNENNYKYTHIVRYMVCDCEFEKHIEQKHIIYLELVYAFCVSVPQYTKYEWWIETVGNYLRKYLPFKLNPWFMSNFNFKNILGITIKFWIQICF